MLQDLLSSLGSHKHGNKRRDESFRKLSMLYAESYLGRAELEHMLKRNENDSDSE